VHIGRRRDDRLGAADHDAVLPALGDMDVGVGILLLARPLGAVALGVRHGDPEREILVLDPLQIRQEPLMIIGAVRGIGRLRRLEAGIERIVVEIALRAAAAAAQQPHRLELVEQVGRACVDRQHARHRAAAASARFQQRRVVGIPGKIIAHTDRGDAGGEPRVVGDAFDRMPVDEHPRRIAAQRPAIIGGRHEHGSLLAFVVLFATVPATNLSRGSSSES
jgi:hypothetical protein